MVQLVQRLLEDQADLQVLLVQGLPSRPEGCLDHEDPGVPEVLHYRVVLYYQQFLWLRCYQLLPKYQGFLVCH